MAVKASCSVPPEGGVNLSKHPLSGLKPENFTAEQKIPSHHGCWNAARATFLHPTTHPTCHAFLVLAPVTVMTALTRSLQSPHLTSRLLAQAARSICSRHLLAAAVPSSL